MSDKDIFGKFIKTYKNALKWSGFKEELNCIPSKINNRQSKRKKKLKVIWLNRLNSSSVKTNIRKTFLRQLSKRFWPDHNLHKIFHRKIVKINCIRLRNVSSVESILNRIILSPNQKSFGVKCRIKIKCQLNDKFLITAIVCQVYVTKKVNGKGDFYFSLADTNFKEKGGNHIGRLQIPISWKYIKISKSRGWIVVIPVFLLYGQLSQTFMRAPIHFCPNCV